MEAVLVGNGINLGGRNSVSWQQLLEKLSSQIDERQVVEFIDKKPFTLLFEEILFKSTTQKEIEIKRKVADLFGSMTGNERHKMLMGSRRYSQILTTNYDYALQSAAGEKPKGSSSTETKYSLFRKNEVGQKCIWHIHGESNAPNSIMLGHEHYAGQLQKLREWVTDHRSGKTESSPFKQHIDWEANPDIRISWLDIFLSHNVHIVGFSFGYTEIELWWALSYKIRLSLLSGYQVGKTFFHTLAVDRIQDETKRAEQLAFLSLLESYGVQVRSYDSYDAMYDTVFS